MATRKKKTSGRKSSKSKALSERSLWKGSISFGLVNIAVKAVSAREQPDLHFSMLDPHNLAPVGYKYYNKATGDEISRGETVKAFEHKPGKYVVLSDADFKKANPKATQTIDIENFVALDDIDPVFFDRAYYLTPQKGGEKAYNLLRDALLKSRRVAIAKIVLHTKQHLVALIPRGNYLLLELLHFANEVKELRELGDWKEQDPPRKTFNKEVEMAERLISDMSAPWKPEDYTDTYREDIMKLVERKVRAGKATEITEETEAADDAESSKVVDLMPLLRQSLEGKRRGKERSGSRGRRAH